MNGRSTSLIIAVLLVGTAAPTLTYLCRDSLFRSADTVLSPNAAEQLQRLETSLEALTAKVDALARRLTQSVSPADGGESLPENASRVGGTDPLLGRLAALERSMSELRKAVEGLQPPKNMPTTEDFASARGYAHADDFYSKGDYGQAANGYETFLEHHGDDPDARKLLEKLREAYSKTGDPEKAIAVQEERIRRFPEESDYEDYMVLARMKRDLGNVEEAVSHTEQAIAKAPDTGALVGGHMTRAWFIEERDGSDAGLAAYRSIEQLILERGWTDSAFLEPCRKNISRIEEKLSTRRSGK